VVSIASLTRSSAKGKPPLVLYSTQTYLKFRIQHDFIGKHRVWCSPVFDAEKQNKYAVGANQPDTADPISIYRDLHRATIIKPDDHNAKIASQKVVLNGLSVDWHSGGHISDAERDEIIALVQHSRNTEWKPILLVIPFITVKDRVIDVPRKDRASSEPEFIVKDLIADEFDIIEVAI
jgi:hypothetical protein